MLHALAERYGFDLDTPFCDYPEKIRSILLHGTDGEKVDVYYEGQRGEGVYPVAFEGLIQNVEQTIPRDRIGYDQSRNMKLSCVSRRVRPVVVCG